MSEGWWKNCAKKFISQKIYSKVLMNFTDFGRVVFMQPCQVPDEIEWTRYVSI